MSYALVGIPIQFAVLDVLVHDSLPRRFRFVEFERKQEMPGRVVYELRQYELGQLGEIIVTMTGDATSDLRFRDPKRASQRLTEEDVELLHKVMDDDERSNMMVALQEQRRTEARELDRRRKRYQQEVIQALSRRLEQHPAWEVVWGTEGVAPAEANSLAKGKPKRQGSKPGPKKTAVERRICIVEGWNAMEGALPQHQYLNRVHTSPTSLRRWRAAYEEDVEEAKRTFGPRYDQVLEEVKQEFRRKGIQI